MTAIVGVINSQGIAIAADSALTVSGGNIKKVYNKSNKIFTLSKYHPVGIAIYNSANFMSIPLETLIKMYRAGLKDKCYDTLKEYKDDFLKFLADSTKFVSQEIKAQHLYGLCNINYTTLPKNIIDAINAQGAAIQALKEKEAETKINEIAASAIKEYLDLIDGYEKSKITKIGLPELESTYKNELENIIQHIEDEVKKVYENVLFSGDSKKIIKQTMLAVCNLENIFELSCGLVFIGFGDMEVYPSSQVITLGSAIGDKLRYWEQEIVTISPGIMNSNILPYVQGDVTHTVLTGIDPTYESEINKSIETAFETISAAVKPKIKDANESQKIAELITKTASELIGQLDKYKNTTITGPLLDTLVHMGKEDMAELAESLVNITSLKRKFTTADPSDESVGGPVDVAIITKGDGFIWMKRKHYFDTDINKGFLNKYYS
jgi:ATP-dependent protease HslVU (ClpYQ) peptidase subunit